MLTRSIAKLRICSPSTSSLTALAPSSSRHLLQLPPELLHHLFSFLPLADCGQLCLTSHEMRGHVLSWILSTTSISQLTESTLQERDSEVRFNNWLKLCRQAGIFCKRANMTEIPGRRVAEVFVFFKELQGRGCAGLDDGWIELQRRAGLAALLHSLTLGWHDTELKGVIKVLVQNFSELRLLYDPTLSVNISMVETRTSELRCVLRTFMWDFHIDEASQAAWLAFILREFAAKQHQTMQHSVCRLQATLLVFMLGSTRWLDLQSDFQQSTLSRLQVTPDQRMLQDQSFTQSYAQAKLNFGDLGKALRILETHKEDVELGVSLNSLMTAVFQDWDIDNSAACLLFSSEEVVARFLTGLMREGNAALEEVAKVVVAMLTVCEALGNNLNEGLVKIIDFTFSALPRTEMQRKLLISLFWRELVERLEFGDLQVSQDAWVMNIVAKIRLEVKVHQTILIRLLEAGGGRDGGAGTTGVPLGQAGLQEGSQEELEGWG